ncbi:MAG: PKD domain-containing protein [Euryarchaeota archaeon]|nr:PKD domain-containing protein [Euryarchaeota archaeon]
MLPLAPTAAAQDDPTPDFTWEPLQPKVGEAVRFIDASANPSSNPIVNWTWDFGDGQVAYAEIGEDPNVTHTFATGETFFVQLVVTPAAGSGGSTGKWVVVYAPVSANAIPHVVYWVMPLAVSAILFVLAYIVVSRGQPAVYNLVFFLFYLVSATKSLTEAFIILLPGGGLDAGATHLNAWCAYLLGPLFLWFVLVFPRPALPWLAEGRRGGVVLLLAVPFMAADLFGAWDYLTATNVFNVYVSALALTCLGILVYHAWDIDSAEERHRIRILAVSFFILVFSSLVLTTLDIIANTLARQNDPAALEYANAQAFFGLLIVPLLEIVGAVLLLYAILRYQLMGVDRLLKKITRNGVVGVTLPATFITLGNTIEYFFEQTVLAQFEGLQLGFIIAGFVATFAMVPLQKWVTFLINKWFPALESPDEISRRRMEIYEAQLRYHLLDGSLNEKEYRILRRLREEVQLAPDELAAVVRRFPGVDPGSLSAPAFAKAGAARS